MFVTKKTVQLSNNSLNISFCVIVLDTQRSIFAFSSGLPSACDSVLEKCLRENIMDIKPDQLTVNQYQPGQGALLFHQRAVEAFHVKLLVQRQFC